MACNSQPTFFKLGSYIIRSDRIIALNKEQKNKSWNTVILYDWPLLKSLTHPCGEDETAADSLMALLCRGSVIDVEHTLETIQAKDKESEGSEEF